MKREPLPRNVVALGWVSLLTDAASDMIYPLLPVFLMQLGGGAQALGWLEGVAEAVSAVVKLQAGRAADRRPRAKPLIALGYGISALTRPLFAIVSAPAYAVAVRALDRVGKGLRGPPRDALVAASVEPQRRGHAFGFHRMMDNLGGVAGPVIAFALMKFAGLSLRQLFAAALLPGLLSVAVILLAVREATPAAPAQAIAAPLAEVRWAPGAKRYFAALGLFTLAGAGDLFLMRRFVDLGLAEAWIPLVWMGLQLGKGALNVPGGRVSDRYGRARVLAAAWALYAVAYAAFGLVSSWPLACGALAVYAAHYGLAEGGQRAMVAELVPAEARGRAFGVQLAIEGLAILPANVAFGAVYDAFGARAAFCGAAGFAAFAACVLATAGAALGR